MVKKKKLFVMDTNIPLHDYRCWSSFKEHDIAVPIEVLSEIDKFKKGNDPINYNAREFVRFLDSLPEEKIFDGGASLGKKLGKVKVVLGFEYHEEVSKIFPEKSMDHMIINAAYCLSHDSKNERTDVVLISKDVNMRMKAKSLGLKAEDYKTDTVSNVESLYEGAKMIKISENEMSELYSSKQIDFQKSSFRENDFFILNVPNPDSKKNSALGVFNKGKISLITKDQVSPFGIKPKNSEQAFAMSALLNPEIQLVTIIGRAGTGKTIVSLAGGLQQVEKGIFDELFFTRQTISLGDREIGFLPGDVGDKLNPFMQALWDNLNVVSILSNSERKRVAKLKEDKKIIIEPLNSIRGRSLVKKYFIIDEVQNLTPQEVKAIITRAGEGTKIILIGDISQNDNPRLDERSNGLSYTIEKMRGQDFYAHIVLKKSERSHLAEVAGNLL